MRKRYAKGIISIALALIMVIIPNVSVFAGSEQIYGNIKVRMIEENSEYSKMEIIHLDTGEIEYLESFYYNGEIRHIAKGEGVVQEIISKNDKIYISENGELIQILDLNVENLLIENNELYAGHSLNDFNISPNAWGAWSAPYWTTGLRV